MKIFPKQQKFIWFHNHISVKPSKFIGYFKTMNIREFTDNYCIHHGFTPNVVFETADTTAFSYMLQKKEGIALVPSANWMLNFTQNIKLIPLEDKIYRTLVIAWNKNKPLSGEAEFFKNFAVQWFKNFFTTSL